MNLLELAASLAASPVAERILVVLAHFLWQGTLLAGFALAASVLLARRSAESRYVVHSAVLLAMLVAPGVTAALLGPIGAVEPVGGTEAIAVAGLADLPAEALPAVSALPRRATSVNWTRWLLAGYVLGVCGLSLRLAGAMLAGRRLRRGAAQVESPDLLSAYARQLKALGVRMAPALEFSRDVAAPALVGLLRPVILLPLSLASEMSPSQIELLLAHELAHWKRLDPLAVLAQRLAETWLFFHPGVWYVSRQMSHEREYCCDDLVISAGGSAVDYADALVRTAELTLGLSRPGALVLSAAGETSEFGGRVRRLLGAREDRSLRLLSPGGMLTVLAVVALVAAGAGAIFADPPTAKAPPAPQSAANKLIAWIKAESDATADVTLSVNLRCDLPRGDRRKAFSSGTVTAVAFGEEVTLAGDQGYRLHVIVRPAPKVDGLLVEPQYILKMSVQQQQADGTWETVSSPRMHVVAEKQSTIEVADGQRKITIEIIVKPRIALGTLELEDVRPNLLGLLEVATDTTDAAQLEMYKAKAELQRLEAVRQESEAASLRAAEYLQHLQARLKAEQGKAKAQPPDAAGEKPVPAAEGLAILTYSQLKDANRRKSSLRNLQLLLLMLQEYEEVHKRWPASLAELKEDYSEYEKVLSNPRTGANPGYRYQPPKAGSAAMLWELKEGKVDPQGAIGYADGRLEAGRPAQPSVQPVSPSVGEVDPFSPTETRSAPDKRADAEAQSLSLPPGTRVFPKGSAKELEFFREEFLDILGRLPTAEETQDYLKEKWPGRQGTLVESLQMEKALLEEYEAAVRLGARKPASTQPPRSVAPPAMPVPLTPRMAKPLPSNPPWGPAPSDPGPSSAPPPGGVAPAAVPSPATLPDVPGAVPPTGRLAPPPPPGGVAPAAVPSSSTLPAEDLLEALAARAAEARAAEAARAVEARAAEAARAVEARQADIEFIRRLSLDLRGRAATDEEMRELLGYTRSDRREFWVDELLRQKAMDERAAKARVRAAEVRKAADEEIQILEKLAASYQREYERLSKLREKGFASDDDMERSERELLEARLRLSKARAANRQTTEP